MCENYHSELKFFKIMRILPLILCFSKSFPIDFFSQRAYNLKINIVKYFTIFRFVL